MIQFAIFATLLVVVVSAFILPPLWFGRPAPKTTKADRKETNLAIFRDQQAELEREHADGSLADADFEQAKRELQRRLLEEVEPAGTADATAVSHAPSRVAAVFIMFLLPILGLVGYGILGNPRALEPEQRVAQPEMTQEKINGMVAKLAERLKANPDDQKGWLMLARSYRTLERYQDAVDAYSKAEKLINEDPDLLALYAETMAMANGNSLKGKPTELVNKALKLNPKHDHSLFLAGAAAMEAGDNKKGIAYWETLLPQVEPDSEIDQMLRSGIEKMKKAGNK